MSRWTALAVAAGALALPVAAQAHVTLQPTEAPAEEFKRLDIRVPNERDDASTEKVVVQMPPGFIFVSTEPVSGWRARVSRSKLAQPVEVFGERQTEQVSRITLTAESDADKIAPGQFRDFGLSVRVPGKEGDTLSFRALQTYDSGEVVRWIGPPDSEEPAARVRVTAPVEEGGAAGGEEEDDDDDGNGLAIAALIVGGLGLLAGLFSLSRARRAAT